MASSFDRPRTMETNTSHSSLTYRKEASQVHSRYQAHPKHTASFSLVSSSSASVHPSSDCKQKPVARTVSSISHLNIQTGQLCRAEDKQQFQLPSQSISSSGTPLSSLPFLSTTTNSSSPLPPPFPSLSQPSSSSNTWSDRRPYRQQHQRHYRHHHHHQEQQPPSQQQQQQRAQYHTKGSMIRTDQGRHVQETTAAFSRLMADGTTSKSPNVLPSLAISTPPSLSPMSGTPTTSPSLWDSLSSWTATPYITSTSSTETAAENENPLFLISQPIMPMSVIPAAIMGIKSTPSCVSMGGTAAVSSTSHLPLVGRDYLSYSSLHAAMSSGMVVAESTPRPLSSMEYAESWLPEVTPVVGSPTGTVQQSQDLVHCSSLSEYTIERKVSSDRESIHPFEMGPEYTGDSLPAAVQELPRHHQRPSLRKKTSFAARLRKVFVKQGPSSSVETQEDIVSLSSNEDNKADDHEAGPSLPSQHRGSVSSTSSSDTALGHGELRRGSTQTVTPLTSPETSPLNSPTMPSLGEQFGSESSLSCPLPALDVECTTESNDSDPQAAINDPLSWKAAPSRAVKKRLTFASISSLFGSRNPQERRAKQQRSSSVPHVESPLAIVGRQIAGFQRRHSLNDLHDSNNNVKTREGQSIQPLVTPPWDRDHAALQGQSATSGSASAPASTMPIRKMSLNNVFSKQLSKKKKKSSNAPAPVPLPAKPLKSALVRRSPASTPARAHHVHSVSRRRSASIRSQSSPRRRSQHSHHHQHSHQQQCHTSQQPSSSDDPFARLAEANQVLASLSKWDSEDQQSICDQSRRASQSDDQELQLSLHGHQYSSSAEYDFCTSPTSFEAAAPFDGPQSPRRPLNRNSVSTKINQCTLSTPPTPRVLPIMTRMVGPSGHSGSPYSPPFNPLSTLSRSSSRCSFASASEGIGSSSPTSEHSSCSSSCSAYYGSASGPQACSRRPSTDQSFNPLLPVPAARVSVDRIEMEGQTNASATMRSCTSALESTSSTLSNSSTTATTAPSLNYKVCSEIVAEVYAEHQYQRGYRQLQLEQQQLTAQPPSQQQQHEQQLYGYFRDQERQRHYEDSFSVDPPSRRQLQFSTEEPIVYATWTPEQYDRTSDTNITASRLTPAIALKIKLELNHFKSQEMEVHQDSQIYTHFFI